MKNLPSYISIWSSALMVIIVLAGAFAFAFTDFMKDRVYGNKRSILIFVFLVYSVFRGYRIYQILKSKSND